mmetsp:Transcript_31343/g.46103  ORF Transcript_31343/g.46103 Transcript_31343/m.46103 type:complete len:86 (-) Transcript_31343:384-641(-)
MSLTALLVDLLVLGRCGPAQHLEISYTNRPRDPSFPTNPKKRSCIIRRALLSSGNNLVLEATLFLFFAKTFIIIGFSSQTTAILH